MKMKFKTCTTKIPMTATLTLSDLHEAMTGEFLETANGRLVWEGDKDWRFNDTHDNEYFGSSSLDKKNNVVVIEFDQDEEDHY